MIFNFFYLAQEGTFAFVSNFRSKAFPDIQLLRFSEPENYVLEIVSVCM